MTVIDVYLDTVDSTNTYVKENRHSFSPHEITCIIAESQTAGRGQFNRTWISPKGVNLYITFFFVLPKETPWVTELATLLAKTVKHVLEKSGLKPEFKWPNDLRLHGKKLAGVLCEVLFEEHSIDVILGLGLNVNMEEKDLLSIDQPATSLKKETGQSWDKFQLLKQIQLQFTQELDKLKKASAN